MRLSKEELQERVAAYKAFGNHRDAAKALGIKKSAFGESMIRAAKLGLMGTSPVLPGFVIKSIASKDGDAWVKQTHDHGEVFVVPDGHSVKGVSALVDADGRTIQQWVKTSQQAQAAVEAINVIVDELKKELPRISIMRAPDHTDDKLVNQFTVTDAHFGMLAWREETGGSDYDIGIAERLLIDWFSAAIAMSPNASTAVFAQLGDLMHHDGLESVTPAHRHVLDADSRLQKVIRVVIRVVRQVIDMLLQKHKRVHVVMASANHDPASSAWMREFLHAMYENEPRITIDNSADLFYAFEHGRTSLFYHHGHKRGVKNVDHVFVAKFREMYGRSQHSYGHVGHLHSDEVVETNLMRVERHRTLAPADAYAAGGGWLSKRDAKVITYHSKYGEVFRSTLSPEMVSQIAANDNGKKEIAA